MRSYTRVKSFQWWNTIKVSIILLLFVFAGMTCIAHADIYGLVDEPPMRSVSGSLHDIESKRVEVFLDGKWQILSDQTALGFLILRNYVVYDKATSPGFNTTVKYAQWKDRKDKHSIKNPLNPNVNKWVGKKWKVKSDWGPGKSSKNISWTFTVDNYNGICEVTVSLIA